MPVRAAPAAVGRRPALAYAGHVARLPIAVSTLIGMLINFVGINPIRALFWTAVLNGFLAPPLLVIIMLIANDKKIMGERVNKLGINVLGWLTTAVMFAAAIALALTWGH